MPAREETVDFSVSEKIEAILKMVREFMQREVHPLEPSFG